MSALRLSNATRPVWGRDGLSSWTQSCGAGLALWGRIGRSGMSSKPEAQNEPTMEEILASIRRIISEDEPQGGKPAERSEEHTSELQSLMRISYAVFCLKKKKNRLQKYTTAE